MLNYLWAGMMIIGILWGAFHGQLPAVTEGALQSSKEAVTLCITMLGVMSLWTGVLEIGHRSGLVDQLAGRMSPLLTFLFPRLSPQETDRGQHDRQHTGIRMGSHSGRDQGHGGTEKGGGRSGRVRGRDCQQRDVHIPDHKHFIPAADPYEYDRLQKPVRQRESHRHCGAGACGHVFIHSSGSDILQGDGQKAQSVTTECIILVLPCPLPSRRAALQSRNKVCYNVGTYKSSPKRR